MRMLCCCSCNELPFLAYSLSGTLWATLFHIFCRFLCQCQCLCTFVNHCWNGKPFSDLDLQFTAKSEPLGYMIKNTSMKLTTKHVVLVYKFPQKKTEIDPGPAACKPSFSATAGYLRLLNQKRFECDFIFFFWDKQPSLSIL